MIETFFIELGHMLVKFLYAPFMFPKMFWILIPVILAILIMELYFWRYPRLNIEYHKSMENSIFLIFISFDLLRYVAMDGYHSPVKIYVSLGFIIFNVVIALLDFYHKLPISLFSRLSSKFVIAFFSYIMIVLMYSDMLDTVTTLSLVYIILSVLIFFFLIVAVRRIFMILEPKSYEEIESFLNVIEKDLQKAISESKEDITKKITIKPPKRIPDLKKFKNKRK
jgi:hypothetical protein